MQEEHPLREIAIGGRRVRVVHRPQDCWVDSCIEKPQTNLLPLIMVLEEDNHAKRTGQDGEPTDGANSRCQAVDIAQTLTPPFMDRERSDEITREGRYSRWHG